MSHKTTVSEQPKKSHGISSTSHRNELDSRVWSLRRHIPNDTQCIIKCVASWPSECRTIGQMVRKKTPEGKQMRQIDKCGQVFSSFAHLLGTLLNPNAKPISKPLVRILYC